MKRSLIKVTSLAISGIFFIPFLPSSSFAVDLFPKVATVTGPDGEVYPDYVHLWEFSYISDWDENTHYCHVASTIISGLNCNSKEDSLFNAIQITRGPEATNLEQDGKFLSCKIDKIDEKRYKLTAISRNPVQTTTHTVTVNKSGITSSAVEDYSGIKAYISHDTGQIEKEIYRPIKTAPPKDGYQHPLSTIQVNCDRLIIPSFYGD